MKIWLLSDLHLEYADLPRSLVIPEADVCVLAGDLCNGPANGVRWLAQYVAHAMPCIYVGGNHEFYKGSIVEGLDEGRAAARESSNVHFLENECVIIDGVHFIGATLWTDYALKGRPAVAMRHARDRMNDYRRIAEQKKPWFRFLPETALRLHQQSRLFINTALTAKSEKSVVVTHHPPHPLSIPPTFSDDLLKPAYASDLADVIHGGRPTLWLHGHVHDSCDYTLGPTRIVCNPRGYKDENRSFNSELVLEI